MAWDRSKSLELPPEMAADFRNRHFRFKEWAKAHPDASVQELADQREKVRPQGDPAIRRLFERWCVEETRREFGLDKRDEGRGL
jgi:hypothetical protein